MQCPPAPIARKTHTYFWGETEVECFDRTYDVRTLPAFVACHGAAVTGALVYAPQGDALNVVLLNVLPEHQGRGGAWALLDAASAEAQRRGLPRLIVATSNDDLPALALYQHYGFCLADVLTGRLLQHHGGEEAGFGGIPVRDEIRLAYDLDR